MTLYLHQVVCTAAILLAGPVSAQTTTELAGNTLPEFPHFEYVKAINANATMEVAIDPTRFPGIVGQTCDVYVVEAKSASEWSTTPGLIDMTPGGAQTESFVAASIQANTFSVTGPSELNADAGAGLGVGYDVVLDCDQNGTLSVSDFIDGGAGEAGIYAVHDITQSGPFSVTEQTYNLTTAVASAYGIPDSRLAQNLFYPSNISSLGQQPLVIIGHGNGHQFDWYDHIGTHLASYGYVVMSLDNDTGPGPSFAAITQLGHTDAFIEQAELGTIASGDLVGHVDPSKIVWIGHSRGGGGVVIAYNRLVTGAHVPVNFERDSIRLISSMLPTDFFSPGDASDPHDVNYHLWTAAGDTDIASAANQSCCQTYRILDRADGYSQGTTVQGTGHAWFHNGPEDPSVFVGPCSLGPTNDIVHNILNGHLLALVKYYVDGNVPALDFLTRQYESFRPIGVPLESDNACAIVTHEFRNGSPLGNFVMDDFQSGNATNTSSSGGTVTFDVENLTEGLMDDNNADFVWTSTDPFNGAVQAQASSGDTSNGVVFDWLANRSMEWAVPAVAHDFTQYKFFSFRGAQGVKHPNTLAATGDLTFDVTLTDGSGGSSTINISAYGGGLEEPFDRPEVIDPPRPEGAPNEMETVRMRLTDFLNNGSGLDLSDITAVRFDFGPAHGSASGRIVLDDLMLTGDFAPAGFEILEPTMALPAYAGTSTFGSRVLVRLHAAGGINLAPGNLTVSVDGTALTLGQIPTAASDVGGETWLVIAPGPRADGCYDLEVALTAPSGISDVEMASLCYSDAETRIFDRVLAIDKTNSMNRDGTTGVSDDAKMQAARAAAKFFVNLSNTDDQIGVIAFQRRDQDENGSITEPDELVETVFNLVPAVEGVTDHRPAARDAIDLVTPDTTPGFTGPETSPGAALANAREMLMMDGVASHEQTIVLLTDGLENYPPFWSDPGGGGSPLKPTFEGGDIRIDTLGIGGDADDAILHDMAIATGGEFRNLNEGSGSFFLLSRLASWYKAIDEDIRGEQRFFYREGFPQRDLATTHVPPRIGIIPVEANLDWMTVAFHMNIDHAVSVTLFPPGTAMPVTPATPGAQVTADPKHVVYRITRPEAGLWRYRVDMKKPDAEFFAVASAPTLLVARVGPGVPERRPSGDYAVPLRIWIADKVGVRGASVTGTIRRPDGVKVGITLVDNGNAGDGGAGDGIYGHNYIATVPGAHWVEIVANGTSTTDEPFQRFLSTAFVLPGAEKKPVQPGEGGIIPPDGGNSGGSGAGARYVYAVKFLCGKANGETFAAGTYFTGINVRNPEREAVSFRKRFAIAFGQQREGPVSDYVRTKLSAQAAYEIDCPDIYQHAPIRDDFLTGFVVIETPVELDVVAVHTVGGRDGYIQSLEVEPIEPRRTAGCSDLAMDVILRPVWDNNARESVIRTTVRNIGSAPAPATTARLTDPSTPDPSGQPYSDNALVPSLDAGESWTADFRLPYWVYNPDASLVATADAGDTLRECLETNNVARFEDMG